MKKVLILFLSIFSSSFLFAQGKIGVVDMEYLFNEYHKKKIADIDLKKQAETYKKYADELGASLDKLQQEFKKLRDDSLNIALSDVERENKRLSAQDKYRQMKEKEEELKSYSIEKQNLIKAKYEEVRGALVDEIKAVVAKIAEANGYTIILDRSGRTLNQIPAIAYANKEVDITDLVLTELNPDLKEKKKKEKSSEGE